MKTLLTVRWALAMLLGLLLTLPALAKPGSNYDSHGDGANSRVRIIVQDNDTPDDTHVYQQWYGSQIACYNDIDQQTGERICDVLQLVADVNKDCLMLTDRDNARHMVMLTPQTDVVFVKTPGHGGWEKGRSYERGHQADATRFLFPGDLVITSGYLRANGAFVASSVRVMGRAWGNDGGGWNNGDAHPTYGQRAFGDINSVDYRYGRIEVNTNNGRKTIYLAKGGEILVNGQKQTLQYLRRGDRVVFYYRDTNRWSMETYRIVVLQKDDGYPDGDRPCCTDPDYREGGNVPTPQNAPMLEGQLDNITTGLMFNKLAIRSNYGKMVTIYVPKTVDAIDDHGDTISLLNLHQGERLQVYYTEIAGAYIAQQVRVL